MSFFKNLTIVAFTLFALNANAALTPEQIMEYSNANAFISCACGGPSVDCSHICRSSLPEDAPEDAKCPSYWSISGAKSTLKHYLYHVKVEEEGKDKDIKDMLDNKAKESLKIISRPEAESYMNKMNQKTPVQVVNNMFDNIIIKLTTTMPDEKTLNKISNKDFSDPTYYTSVTELTKSEYKQVSAQNTSTYKKPRYVEKSNYIKNTSFTNLISSSTNLTPNSYCSKKYTQTGKTKIHTSGLGMMSQSVYKWSFKRDIDSNFDIKIDNLETDMNQTISESNYDESKNPVYNINANFSTTESSNYTPNSKWTTRHKNTIEKNHDERTIHLAKSLLDKSIKEIEKLKNKATEVENEGDKEKANKIRKIAKKIKNNAYAHYETLVPYQYKDNEITELLNQYNAIKTN